MSDERTKQTTDERPHQAEYLKALEDLNAAVHAVADAKRREAETRAVAREVGRRYYRANPDLPAPETMQ